MKTLAALALAVLLTLGAYAAHSTIASVKASVAMHRVNV